MQTITEAKTYLRQNWDDGTKCPCCNQMVKLYKHRLQALMVYYLAQIYKIQKGKNNWVHVMSEVKPINGDYAKMRFWGLLEEKGDQPTKDTKSSGYWRVTTSGILFLKGRIRVPEKVFIFDNKKWGQTNATVNIAEALKNKFSYSELMDWDTDTNDQPVLF